ncbi:MAG TPA: helix-turn-helix transcriptional regulator [Longimicrobiales bacterium]|nr:helix-turn-helix transcriptional regulator [Longimicrobiales bacterium]
MNIPRLSRKEYLILELLIDGGEMFGLQLVGLKPGQLARGTVYVTLQRMSVKGFVTSRTVDDPAGGPPRRMYRATGRGYRIYSAIHREAGARSSI